MPAAAIFPSVFQYIRSRARQYLSGWLRVVHVSFGLRLVQMEDGAHCNEPQCQAAATWLFSPSMDLKHDITGANEPSYTSFGAAPRRIIRTLDLDPLRSFLGTGLIAYINVQRGCFQNK